MFSREELFQSPEYWIERIQNDIFRALNDYKEKYELNQTQLGEKLGFSKGYISQVMNGNFNFSLSKLVDLSLALGLVPQLNLKDLKEFISEEERRLNVLATDGFTEISLNTKEPFKIELGQTSNVA